MWKPRATASQERRSQDQWSMGSPGKPHRMGKWKNPAGKRGRDCRYVPVWTIYQGILLFCIAVLLVIERYIRPCFETWLVMRYKKRYELHFYFDLYIISIHCTFRNFSNVWLWVTLFMIGVYCLMVMVVCDWLGWFWQDEEEAGLNGEGEDTIDSDFSLGIRSQSFATGPPKVERSQVHCLCLKLM